MKIIKKIGKYLLVIIIFLVVIFLTITVLGIGIIILSKVFSNLWGLNSAAAQALIALLLTAIIFGIINKPYKKLVGKADLLIKWANN